MPNNEDLEKYAEFVEEVKKWNERINRDLIKREEEWENIKLIRKAEEIINGYC